jgi:putative membrane protein
MPHLFARHLLTLVAFASVSLGCGSDQNRPANTPEGMPPSAAPADSNAAPPGEPTPSGEPSGMPPGDPQSRSEPSTSPAPAEPPAATPTPPLSQAQIAMFADLANSSEIEQAKVAQAKAQAASVKKFAGMMVKHHTEAKQEQAKLFQKLNLTPSQSEKSKALKADADKILGALRGAQGATFDVAYMNGQVEAHQKVLEAIDRDLLPAASDQALIDGLKKMRGTVESHLTEAKAVQAQLMKTETPRADAR